jgi:hypothetical protein
MIEPLRVFSFCDKYTHPRRPAVSRQFALSPYGSQEYQSSALAGRPAAQRVLKQGHGPVRGRVAQVLLAAGEKPLEPGPVSADRLPDGERRQHYAEEPDNRRRGRTVARRDPGRGTPTSLPAQANLAPILSWT